MILSTSSDHNNFKALEAALGYRFRQPGLMARALTHRSYSGKENNERLEFLGDALLGAVIAEALYTRFADADEGELTRMRARLVRGQTLEEIAREIDLHHHLVLGSGERRSGGRSRKALREDALEAVFGAIYLEAGFGEVRAVILRLFEKRLASVTPDVIKDPKTRLQEALQKHGRPLPEYEIVSKTGKPHDLFFVVEATIQEPEANARGEGKSRREAEQSAAQALLEAL